MISEEQKISVYLGDVGLLYFWTGKLQNSTKWIVMWGSLCSSSTFYVIYRSLYSFLWRNLCEKLMLQQKGDRQNALWFSSLFKRSVNTVSQSDPLESKCWKQSFKVNLLILQTESAVRLSE